MTIKTDNPQAEIGLFADDTKLAYEIWEAHRTLSQTIHLKIEKLLKDQKKDWPDIQGIVCFKGPGSFTGLRIGLSVGNSLAYGLNAAIVSSDGKEWIENGIQKLQNGQNEKIIVPEYGSPAHITQPKK